MRTPIKKLVNRMLSCWSLKVVNAKSGPQGVFQALSRLKTAGLGIDTVLDVGAARGEWTQECMKVLPDAEYFLVDPLMENQAALDRLRVGNSRIGIWHGALGSSEGIQQFHVHGDQSSFLGSEFTTPDDVRGVVVTTLDSLSENHLRCVPDLLKLDTQGYELEILRGGGKVLQRVKALVLEVSFRRIYEGSPLADEIVSFVSRSGFRIYDICSYIQRPGDGELVQSDFLFVRSSSPIFAYEGYN